MTLAGAHKTGRKYRQLKEKTWGRYGEGQDDWDNIGWEEAIADDWEVEPEVYEVECTWQPTNGDYDDFVQPLSESDSTAFSGDFGQSLIGKRTKLTIEVLDD